MERQKHVSREEVIAAVERFLQRYGSAPIPMDALTEGWMTAGIATSPDDLGHEGGESEVTHVDALEADEEFDMGAMVESAFDSPEGSSVAGDAGADHRPGEVVIEDLEQGGARHALEQLAADLSSARLPIGSPSGASDSSRMGVRDSIAPASSGSSSGGSVMAPIGAVAPVVFEGHRHDGAPAGEATLSRPVQGFDRHPPLDASLSPTDDVVPESWGRYRVDGELARGGQGRILNAFDDILSRPVALKILRKDGVADTRLVSRFYEEAQVTGQLEHPNIVPVHELGWIDNGLPYYTMKKVEGRTLKKVIVGLRKGNPQVIAAYGRIKLMTILQQVCQAISYAHDRGVIHRDLKPANIMLGDYGEVIVLDWGVAKVRGVKEEASQDSIRPVKISRRGSAMDTQVGTVEGTPAYMSPEQARGRIHEIDERTDVYAIGAILYELLTFRPPFRGQDVRDVLRQVVEEEPRRPSEVAPQNQIPEELEQISLRCLAKDAGARYPSVKALQADIEAFLEGTKRRMAAAQKVGEARELVRQHQELKNELLRAKMVASRAAQGIQGWEPVERKRGVWATRSKVQEIEANIVVTFGEAVARFSQALAHEPDNLEAREGLADLFMSQLKKAELDGDKASAVYGESMLRQYGSVKYEAFLKGDGILTLDTDTPMTEVWLYRYEEKDRVLRPVDARRLGIAPVVDVRLPRGSYLVVLRAPGKRDVYYPIRLARLEAWKARVNLYSDAQIGRGFVYIPGGPVSLGGDGEAIDAREQEVRTTGNFAIQEFPVTFREYIDFLNAWLSVDPDEAHRHLPQLDNGVPLVTLTQQGFVPIRDLIGPEGRAVGRQGMEYDIPVFGIDYDDADAFCAWRSEISSLEFRLPSEDEWEKAARGVDGRAFPWGNQFDPTFCKSRLSRPWAPEPEPCGSFPEDTSPYGVRDMAGGVREWCDGWFNEAQGLRVLRGGAWVDTERFLRCASRTFYDPYLFKRVAGFRLARSLG